MRLGKGGGSVKRGRKRERDPVVVCSGRVHVGAKAGEEQPGAGHFEKQRGGASEYGAEPSETTQKPEPVGPRKDEVKNGSESSPCKKTIPPMAPHKGM